MSVCKFYGGILNSLIVMFLTFLSTDTTTIVPQFPFDTQADDHCESPKEAYEDIVPFLQWFMKTKPSCRIYDPYYCNGAVKANLAALGFPNVYNEKEDCYDVWKDSKKLSEFDCLITNPPYSGNHVEQLIRFVTSSAWSSSRPWFLLLPQWVHKKDWFEQCTARLRPFFLVPHQRRYVYLPPPHFRPARKSDVHKKSSPFVSMWYIWGGTTAQTEAWIQAYYQYQKQQRLSLTCQLARSKSALRDLRRKQSK
jgi:hypothetical protein